MIWLLAYDVAKMNSRFIKALAVARKTLLCQLPADLSLMRLILYSISILFLNYYIQILEKEEEDEE